MMLEIGPMLIDHILHDEYSIFIQMHHVQPTVCACSRVEAGKREYSSCF